MFYFAPDAANWALARLIDGAIAGQQMPGWAPLVGLVFAIAGMVALAVMAACALCRRRSDRRRPEPESLLVADPWLADRTEEIPAAPRRPRSRHRYPVACHPPQPQAAATQVIARTADDPNATLVIPAAYGGRRE